MHQAGKADPGIGYWLSAICYLLFLHATVTKKRGKKAWNVWTLNDFQKLENQIEQFKKKGNKVIPLSKTYLVLKSQNYQSK